MVFNLILTCSEVWLTHGMFIDVYPLPIFTPLWSWFPEIKRYSIGALHCYLITTHPTYYITSMPSNGFLFKILPLLCGQGKGKTRFTFASRVKFPAPIASFVLMVPDLNFGVFVIVFPGYTPFLVCEECSKRCLKKNVGISLQIEGTPGKTLKTV